MAYLSVDEQVEAITHTAITQLGMSREAVEAMIAKRDGDRLALNALRVKLNAQHRTACNDMNRRSEERHADEHAEQRRTIHDATLEEAARQRRQQRERQGPGDRITAALTALNAMSTVRAVTMPDPNLKGVKVPKHAAWQDPGVGQHDTVDVSPWLNALTYIVEQLELVLDAERGLISPQDLAKLPGDIKDRVVLTQLRGMRSEQVAEAFPWLGHRKTIERVRREGGQRPVDGTEPRERLSAA